MGFNPFIYINIHANGLCWVDELCACETYYLYFLMFNSECFLLHAFYFKPLVQNSFKVHGQFSGFWQIHTTSQSSPMQAYNQAINDLDKELDYLKNAFEVRHLLLVFLVQLTQTIAFWILLLSIKPDVLFPFSILLAGNLFLDNLDCCWRKYSNCLLDIPFSPSCPLGLHMCL